MNNFLVFHINRVGDKYRCAVTQFLGGAIAYTEGDDIPSAIDEALLHLWKRTWFRMEVMEVSVSVQIGSTPRPDLTMFRIFLNVNTPPHRSVGRDLYWHGLADACDSNRKNNQ